MENQTAEKNNEGLNMRMLPASIIVAAVVLAGAWTYYHRPDKSAPSKKEAAISIANETTLVDAQTIAPPEGVILPAKWGNLGQKLAEAGAIDEVKLKAIYEQRGQFTPEYQNLLTGADNGQLKITRENSGYILNLLWALGLANKNPILDSGEMTDKKYGGAGGFASTAGWTLAKDNPMNYYSRYELIILTDEQQKLVDEISKNIYRPCCNNSVHFPDCNHGMAMLGLLELMASQGANEQEMYQAALKVNSYWFPDTYIVIATYMKNKGIDWKDVSSKEMLGFAYSSASGFAKISAQVPRPKQQGGGGCGV